MKKLLLIICTFLYLNSTGHVITFCGEVVPIDKEFVSNKLMNTVKKNISLVNMADMRQRVNNYFPIFDMYLRKWGVPADFKYLAIVESNLKPVTSPVGAQGFWQIMPATGIELGLKVSNPDERNDLHRSTDAAAHYLTNLYRQLKKLIGVYSWILTAASYNCGAGCIQKRVRAEQQTDYFDLNLNPETANYVYRIIAIKELFEYPEIYMKNFGYNIFNKANANRQITYSAADADYKSYGAIQLKVKKKKKEKAVEELPQFEEKLVPAHIKGKYKNFQDGDLVSLEVDEAFSLDGVFKAKGSSISGTGWLIDDKIYVDLGFGPDVTFCDAGGVKGITPQDLDKNRPILIKAKIWK